MYFHTGSGLLLVLGPPVKCLSIWYSLKVNKFSPQLHCCFVGGASHAQLPHSAIRSTCKSFHVSPFTLLIVPYNSIYYNYSILHKRVAQEVNKHVRQKYTQCMTYRRVNMNEAYHIILNNWQSSVVFLLYLLQSVRSCNPPLAFVLPSTVYNHVKSCTIGVSVHNQLCAHYIFDYSNDILWFIVNFRQRLNSLIGDVR